MNSAFLAVDPMTASRTAIVLLTGFLLGCGPSRITKLPVPRESVLVSYRLMGEADRMLEEGKDHLAILKYLEATNLNPYHEAIFNKLAIAYCRTGRFWQGRKAAEHAIRLDPRYAPAHNTLGIALLSNRQYEKAVRSFEQAIAIDPQSFFYVNLGYQPVAKVVTAFDRPCIPADCVAIRAHTPGMHPNRALSGGRRNGLGARATFATD